MPGICTRLASICRAEVDQSHAHMHQTVVVHQTLQWHQPAAGKGGQLSFTKANISFQVSHWLWLRHWLNLDAIAATDFAKEVFQSPIPIFISSSLNDSTIWLKELLESFKTYWEIYFTFVLLLVKGFQTLGCDLQCVWDQERYLPSAVVKQYISAQTPDQPWHFAAYLKQCTFVLGSAMVVASISETMQFCRHVRAFLLAEWGNKERGFVCQMSLSVQTVHTTLSLPPLSLLWWDVHSQLTLFWLCHWFWISEGQVSRIPQCKLAQGSGAFTFFNFYL